MKGPSKQSRSCLFQDTIMLLGGRSLDLVTDDLNSRHRSENRLFSYVCLQEPGAITHLMSTQTDIFCFFYKWVVLGPCSRQHQLMRDLKNQVISPKTKTRFLKSEVQYEFFTHVCKCFGSQWLVWKITWRIYDLYSFILYNI